MNRLKISITAISLIFCVSQIYPQNEIKKESAKKIVIKDSLHSNTAKDTLKQKGEKLRIFNSIQPKSSFLDNAEGYILKKDKIYKSDYKSIGDLFYTIPFGYEQHLGTNGLPDEVLLYGNGFGAVTYNDDGISINNRLFNSYDLYNFQSEKIDSVEIYSLPQAFLFSQLNNNSTINFISKDRVKDKQYSRIRYAEGINNDGNIDFIFNMPLSKVLFVTTEITNNSIDSSYGNNTAGGWRAAVKLRYLFSDKINLVANYNYVNTMARLTGGVDTNAVYHTPWQNVLYDSKTAMVITNTRDQHVLEHRLSLRALASVSENINTDLTLYYNMGLNKFRQNEYSTSQRIVDDNKFIAIGAYLNQSFAIENYSLKIMMNYETNQLNADLLGSQIKNNLFSIAAIGTVHLADNFITPSVYAKSLLYNSNHYFGAGGDLNFTLTKNIYAYAGLSYYKKPYNVFEELGLENFGTVPSQNINNIEAGLRYVNNNNDIKIGLFRTENSNYAVPVIVKQDTILNNSVSYAGTTDRKLNGINLSFHYRIFKILAEGNMSYLTNYNAELVNNPQFTFDGGIYYVDTLFNANLDLKAGFNFKYYSAQNFIYYDFEKYASSQYIRSSLQGANNTIGKTSDLFRIDFFLAGKIQNAATLYLTFENLLNTNYYMLPYYPALGRHFRIGVYWEFWD